MQLIIKEPDIGSSAPADTDRWREFSAVTSIGTGRLPLCSASPSFSYSRLVQSTTCTSATLWFTCTQLLTNFAMSQRKAIYLASRVTLPRHKPTVRIRLPRKAETIEQHRPWLLSQVRAKSSLLHHHLNTRQY